MADVKTDSHEKPEAEGSGNFVFGQNMEDRVVQRADGEGSDPEQETKEENASENTNGEDSSSNASVTTASPLLRPSAFSKPVQSTGAGILAPSKLGNPFVPRPPPPQSNSTASQNDDEKKEKPLVAPSHFGSLTPGRHVCDDKAALSTPKFVLRPSALDKQAASLKKENNEATPVLGYKTSFRLEPAKLQSPLSTPKLPGGKPVDSESAEPDSSTDITVPKMPASESAEGRSRLFGDDTPESSNASSADSSAAPSSQKDTSDPDSSKNSVIFGQNLEDRVTNTPVRESGESRTGSGGFIFGQNLSDRVTGTPSKGDEEDEGEKSPDDESSGKTLEEAAAAEQAKQSQPEYQEIEVRTGEEEESNVFQINAKLFVFDKTSQSWKEKGRGQLRLNDMSLNDGQTFHSRLVMRTQGSLRVVMNTKVWPGMTVERASQKSIRITAMDGEGSIKVFLIMAQPNDADQIFSAIDWRIQRLKMSEWDNDENGAEADSSVPDDSQSQCTQPEKRQTDSPPDGPAKKQRIDPEQRREAPTEESNDSSTVDPETEASNESFASSPTVKSSSSDA